MKYLLLGSDYSVFNDYIISILEYHFIINTFIKNLIITPTTKHLVLGN